MRYFPEAKELQTIPCLAIEGSPEGFSVLGNWLDGGDPCVIQTQAQGFLFVLNTGLLLHESLLAKIASNSGVHLFTPIGSTVHANVRFASLWTRDSKSEFVCPKGMVARSLWPQDSEAPSTTFTLPEKSCTLLALDPMQDNSPFLRERTMLN